MDFIADLKARLHRIEFKPQAGPGEDVLLEFSEPAPSQGGQFIDGGRDPGRRPRQFVVRRAAGLVRAPRRQGRIARRKDLRSLMESTGTGRPVPIITVKVEDVLVFWRPGWATVKRRRSGWRSSCWRWPILPITRANSAVSRMRLQRPGRRPRPTCRGP